MDTLSTSVSTFNIPSLHPKLSHELHHFKNHFPQQPHLNSTTKPKPSKVSSKTTTTTTFTTQKNNFIPPLLDSNQNASPLKQPFKPEFHQKPTTGYAVALLDISRRRDVLKAVERDVKKLSKWLHDELLSGIITNASVGMREKGDILKEVVTKGRLHKYLVKLVNLLVEKSKVGMIGEVLVEFVRIYDELIMSGSSVSNDQVVLVPPGLKMEQNQVLEMAKRVQKLSGAVKVTVRQLVDERLPSFPV